MNNDTLFSPAGLPAPLPRPAFADWRIALAQYAPRQADTAWNLEKMLSLIDEAAAEGASLIVFPELSYTGYWINHHTATQLAEPADGPFVQTMQKKAAEKGIHILAGYAELTHEKNPDRTYPPKSGEADEPPRECYNACVLIDDGGVVIGGTRKVYRWKKEKQIFLRGTRFPVYETKLGRIAPMICYDMEFSEAARLAALQGADIILNAAAWSHAGLQRWDLDLRAAAQFNLLYVAGANVADERCCGSSMLIDPNAQIKARAGIEEERLLYGEICAAEIQRIRDILPYWDDYLPATFGAEAVRGF